MKVGCAAGVGDSHETPEGFDEIFFFEEEIVGIVYLILFSCERVVA
jgi:hypothetical protein